MFEADNYTQDRIEARVINDDHPVDRLPVTQGAKDAVKNNPEGHDLDGEGAIQLHSTLMGHYYRELDRQVEPRLEMEIDENMYDHVQWTNEEIQVLEERGQVALQFNIIATAVNWILGSQRRARTDYSILPRRKEGAKHAQHKTELMKYLSDVNHSDMHWSRGFADAVKVGVGWMETGYQSEEDGEIVYERYESWRNVLWDSAAMEMDIKDGRYIFRTKWTDLDLARGVFPRRAGQLESATENVYQFGSSIDSAGDEPMDSIEDHHFNSGGTNISPGYASRLRVRLFEAWFTRTVNAKVVKGGDFNGELFDERSEGHVNNINDGISSIVSKPKLVVMVAIFTTNGLLYYGQSPYRHGRYPLTPIWGNRRAYDNMPYGVIRGIRDPQRDLNKRASKSLHLLNSTRMFVQEGAVEDHDETREEAALPDAYIIYKDGKPAPILENDLQLAAAHADFMARDIEMIQQVGGVTDENMGRQTNATSGKAIMARQDQGALSTSHFFDNLHFAKSIHGEKLLANIEQFFTEEKQFRITNERGNPEYININKDMDDDPNNDNWITRTKADFIISEQDWRATARQTQADGLMDLLTKLAATAPEIVIKLLDLMVESMDIPKQDEIVKRIRQVTGVTDPDADPDNPDPETVVQMESMAKAQAAQDRMSAAQMSDAEGKAAESMAKARKTMAEAMRSEGGIKQDQLQILKDAVDGAIEVMGTQGASFVADALIAEAEAQTLEIMNPPLPPEAEQPQQPETQPNLEGEIR